MNQRLSLVGIVLSASMDTNITASFPKYRLHFVIFSQICEPRVVIGRKELAEHVLCLSEVLYTGTELK